MENEPRIPESILNIFNEAELQGMMGFAIKKAYISNPRAKDLVDKKIAGNISDEETDELKKLVKVEFDKLNGDDKLGHDEIQLKGNPKLN